ncbi:HdeD family acid-resistance protein [Streptococcus fryi]
MMRSEKLLALLSGLLYSISAIYLMVNPAANLLGMSWLLAFSVLLGGVSEIVFYFKLPKFIRDGWKLLSGVMTLVFGVFLLSGGFVALPVVLPTLIGIWLLMFNVTRLVRAFQIRRILLRLSNYLLVTGILGLLLGILLVNNPIFGSLYVAYLIALSFLYQGITLILDAFKA